MIGERSSGGTPQAREVQRTADEIGKPRQLELNRYASKYKQEKSSGTLIVRMQPAGDPGLKLDRKNSEGL